MSGWELAVYLYAIMIYRYSARRCLSEICARHAGITAISIPVEQPMTQQTQRLLAWLLLLALMACVSYLTFRAYLSPDFLIGFANQLSC
jgi:hypothetical protein